MIEQLNKAFESRVRLGIMSVLAGDVWRTGNTFQDMLLSAKRYEGRLRVGQHGDAGGNHG